MKIPAVAAGLGQRAAGGLGEHIGVVRPMDGVGVALRAGEVGGRGAGVDVDLVLGLGHAGHGQAHAGIGHFDDQVHAFAVIPLGGDAGADIGLVLVIGGDDIDLEALGGRAEILQRLVDAGDGDGAGQVLVGAGQIGQHADPEPGALGAGAGERQRRGGGGGKQVAAGDRHRTVPCSCFRRRDSRAACPCWRRGRRCGSGRPPRRDPSRSAGRRRWRRSGNSVPPAAP